MILGTFSKKLTFVRRKCDICGRRRSCCQHHVFGRKNNESSIIWVCSNGGDVFYTDPCHAKIHNPSAFGLSADWSYDNGYLQRMDSVYRRRPRKKVQLKKTYNRL